MRGVGASGSKLIGLLQEHATWIGEVVAPSAFIAPWFAKGMDSRLFAARSVSRG